MLLEYIHDFIQLNIIDFPISFQVNPCLKIKNFNVNKFNFTPNN